MGIPKTPQLLEDGSLCQCGCHTSKYPPVHFSNAPCCYYPSLADELKDQGKSKESIMCATLRSDKIVVPFSQIPIGKLFFYKERFWVRLDYYSGSDIGNDIDQYRICQFFVTKDMLSDDGDVEGWIDVEQVDVIF